MGNTPEKKNAVVLTDGSGNWYAVPLEILEEHKVTGDRKAEVEKLFGDTASGYQMSNAYAPTQNMSDLNQLAADPQRLANPNLADPRGANTAAPVMADMRPMGAAADASEALAQVYGVMAALPASLFTFGKK